jgi:hypothetical protein
MCNGQVQVGLEYMRCSKDLLQKRNCQWLKFPVIFQSMCSKKKERKGKNKDEFTNTIYLAIDWEILRKGSPSSTVKSYMGLGKSVDLKLAKSIDLRLARSVEWGGICSCEKGCKDGRDDRDLHFEI